MWVSIQGFLWAHKSLPSSIGDTAAEAGMGRALGAGVGRRRGRKMSSATGGIFVKQVLEGGTCLSQQLITDLHMKLKILLFNGGIHSLQAHTEGFLYGKQRVNPTLHPHSCLS